MRQENILTLVEKDRTMNETIFQVKLPPKLLSFGFNQTQVQNNITEWLVFSLFTDTKISSGKAAELLDISRIEFLQLLRERGIAYIDYSDQELEEEFDTSANLSLMQS